MIHLFTLDFIKGVADRVEYVPGSGRQDLFPEASINLCDFPCQPESIQARIALGSPHQGKNCDRDTYTVQVRPFAPVRLENFSKTTSLVGAPRKRTE